MQTFIVYRVMMLQLLTIPCILLFSAHANNIEQLYNEVISTIADCKTIKLWIMRPINDNYNVHFHSETIYIMTCTYQT